MRAPVLPRLVSFGQARGGPKGDRHGIGGEHSRLQGSSDPRCLGAGPAGGARREQRLDHRLVAKRQELHPAADRRRQARRQRAARDQPSAEGRTATSMRRSPPTARRVVFERDFVDESIPAEIHLANVSGTDRRQLDLGCVDPCVLDSAPTWLRGGGRLAYTPVIGPFDQVNGSATSAVLHTSRLDGSGYERLSQPGIDGAFEDYHAHFSRDGSYLVFVRVRNSDIKGAIFRMDADGSHLRRLTPWRLGADLPDLSPAASGPTKDLVVFETFGLEAPRRAHPKTSQRCRRPADTPQVPWQDPLSDPPRRRAGPELQPGLVAERPPDRLHAVRPRRQAHAVRGGHLDDGSERPPQAGGFHFAAVRVPAGLGAGAEALRPQRLLRAPRRRPRGSRRRRGRSRR